MRVKISSLLLVASVIIFSGCSKKSSDIPITYISPMQYQNYSCDQLIGESQRIQQRVGQIGGRLDEAAANDKMLTGVGVVLFWPALFALGGTKEQEAEYGRLKGEYEAVQQSAIAKNCTNFIYVSNKDTNDTKTTN